jgi:hypothetical protein
MVKSHVIRPGDGTYSFAVQIMFPDHHGIDRAWFFKCQEREAPRPPSFWVAHNCAGIHLVATGLTIAQRCIAVMINYLAELGEIIP